MIVQRLVEYWIQIEASGRSDIREKCWCQNNADTQKEVYGVGSSSILIVRRTSVPHVCTPTNSQECPESAYMCSYIDM